jgi:hypothetical protein
VIRLEPHKCHPLVVVQHSDSTAAVESSRKRVRSTSQLSSQAHSPPAVQGKHDAEVMQGIARSLGTRAKDLLALLGLLHTEFVSPQHVQAFLIAVPDLESKPPRSLAPTQPPHSLARCGTACETHDSCNLFTEHSICQYCRVHGNAWSRMQHGQLRVPWVSWQTQFRSTHASRCRQ